MKRLISYLKQDSIPAVMAPLFKCLEACFELFVPLVVARMIDVGIKNGDNLYILRMGGLLLLLAAIGLTCSITAQYFAASVAAKFGTRLRGDLFRHITGFGCEQIDQFGSSTLLTRMTSDINQVQTGVNMFLRLFMRSPFIVFGAVIMAFTVDVRGALIFAVTVPLLAVIVFGILLGSMPLYQRVQYQLDKVTLSVRENLLGVRVIRAFNREQSEQEAFQRANDRLAKFQIFVGKISALMNPLTVVIVNLSIVALLMTGSMQVNAGALSQGKVVALVNYMSQILAELVKLANLIILISKAMACMKRVDGVFAVENPMEKEDIYAQTGESKKSKASGAVSKVSFQDVSFSYAGAMGESLSHIQFDAMPGETIGIIGGTGAGKSTLLRLIPRLYDASKGSVIVDGMDVRDWNLTNLRSHMGIVPQKAALFAGSIRDNMRFGKKDASDEEIWAALKTAQAAEIVQGKEGGLDFQLEQGGRNLSGGQRQRLTIARALVRKPDILLLDDAASALDFATDAALRKALHTDTAGMTVFVVSQRVSAVKFSDRIVVLEDGNQVGLGTHRQLLKTCDLYREICMTQMTKDEVARDEA